MDASPRCAALSVKCAAGPNILVYFFVFLGVTLDAAETTFAKPPFLCSWITSKLLIYHGSGNDYTINSPIIIDV